MLKKLLSNCLLFQRFKWVHLESDSPNIYFELSNYKVRFKVQVVLS